MKKNKMLPISVIFIVVSVGLIGIAALMIINSYDKKNQPQKNGPNSENTPIDSKLTYTCRKKVEETSEYVSYLVERILVDNDLAKTTTSITEIQCHSETLYFQFKEDSDYSKNKNFDDESLTITFNNYDSMDLTKDSNGKDMDLKWSDYQSSLENAKYQCEKN